MNKTITKLMGWALVGLLLAPSSVKAQTTLASWTFDTEYDASSNVYTPNATALTPSSEAVGTTAIWTWSQQILPNTYLGTQSDYYISGKTARYWYLKETYYNSESNYGPFVFQIVNDSEASSITDYTDASQHNNYFEISFPTTNYKNINLSYKLSSGSTTADEMTVVCSKDGGTTWGVVGTTTISANWWVMTSDTKELTGTANKANVKVRIFAANGVKTNWNIDDVVITGEYATEFAEEYTLTTSVSPSGSGTITRSPNAATYEENTVVTLTATPNIGYAFVEWQDGVGNQLSTANPYDVTMTEDKTIVAVYEIAPIAAGTEITAASWNFNTGYEFSGGIYVPNDEDWAQNDWTWSDSQFRVNSSYGQSTNYIAAVKRDRAWRFDQRGGQNTLCLYSQGGTANNISDYTNASQHNQYYQFSFPTTGLKDIKVSFAYTYYSARDGKLELVYSTDGGTTWIDKAAYATGSDANTFATHSEIEISADNKTSVIVRLIQSNGVADYCYLDYFTVSGTIATTSVSISEAKYATYYNSIPVQLPANLQAATIDDETSGTLTFNYRYSEGDVIPSGTPVLLKATAAGEYTLTYAANDATAAPTGNYLYGSDEAVTTTGGGTGAKYYALQYGAGDKASVLGFYWVNTDGAAFTSGAHKAWLALPAAASASYLSLDADDMTTGIEHLAPALSSGEGAQSVFNLNGQRVSQPRKGLYLVNGKKVIINK